MMTLLLNYLGMDGYGAYIWTAYGIVLAALSWQWFMPWRRLRKYQRSLHEHHS